MSIKHTLENPINRNPEVNWFKIVFFMTFTSIILSLGIVIGATLNSTISSPYIAQNFTSNYVQSTSIQEKGTLNFGIMGELSPVVKGAIFYTPPKVLNMAISQVLVEKMGTLKWIQIPVSNKLVNLEEYTKNVYYLSSIRLPVGKYSGIKIYFKYISALLQSNKVVNIPLYDTSIILYNKFLISNNSKTYIAPVFNINNIINSWG